MCECVNVFRNDWFAGPSARWLLSYGVEASATIRKKEEVMRSFHSPPRFLSPTSLWDHVVLLFVLVQDHESTALTRWRLEGHAVRSGRGLEECCLP